MRGKNKTAYSRRLFTLLLALVMVISVTLIWPLPFMVSAETASNTITPPSELTVSAKNAGQVDLAWKDNSNNEDGFQIERASDRSFTRDVKSFKVGSNITKFEDNSTQPLTVYYYRVLAYTSENQSDWSNIAIILTPDLIPAQPSNLLASSPAPFTVNLSWTDNSNNETGFKIERASDEQFTQNLTTFTTEANVTVCQDSIVPGGRYYYRIQAYNTAGNSPFSNAANIVVGSKIVNDQLLFGGQTVDVSVNGFAPFYIPFKVGAQGVVQGSQDIKLNSVDGKVSVMIPNGSTMLNINQHPLTSFAYQAPDILPEPPPTELLIQGYNFGPAYSTFNPGIKMTFKFDTTSLPVGANSGDIQLASWDGSKWETINGATVNVDSGEVSATITHFSILAILCNEPTPTNTFSVSDLVIYPRYSNAGQMVRIQVKAINNSSVPGNYKLVLTLNDNIEETRYVAIEPNTSYTETFNVNNQKPGYYAVNLNGLKDYFIVNPEETQTTTSSKTTITTPLTVPTFTLETPKPGFIPSGPNTSLIIIIASVMGVILIGSLAIFFLTRK